MPREASREFTKQVGEVSALAHLLRHILADFGDARVVRVLPVAHQQVELRVFLHLDAQLVEALDRRVAGEEVLGSGSEGDDFEIFDADDGSGDRNKLRDHLRDLRCGAHGVFGDVALELAHAQVVGAVQHAAVGVASAVDEVAVSLGGGHEHAGAVKVLGDQGLRGLGAEVAEEDHQGVAAGGLHVLDGFQHIQLIFDGDGAGIDAFAELGDGGAAGFAEGDGEAVAADRDQAELDFRNVVHHVVQILLDVYILAAQTVLRACFTS